MRQSKQQKHGSQNGQQITSKMGKKMEAPPGEVYQPWRLR